MNTFLHYVAQDILDKYGYNLSRIAVVFPNKRAALFLNEELAQLAHRPLWSPSYITISELFTRHSEKILGDPIKLICDLHKVFVRCTGMNETLDHFYGWGQVLLNDFDDIDKNMADAHQVFANLSNVHELDDISYLTDEQKEMLKRFFSNFSDQSETALKEKFLKLWSNLENIYTTYRAHLSAQQLVYEGALYREVVENPSIDFQYDAYLFVGFNMMQVVEQQLCTRLQKEGKAFFYWDYDDYYMHRHGALENEAGTFIRQYLKYFPNALDGNNKAIYNAFEQPKSITFISATTEDIQAQYINQWLSENNRIADGRKTAIVLANETLLQDVIHAIPESVENVNITTGFPLAQAPAAAFVKLLIGLRTMGYRKTNHTFRKKWVDMLQRHHFMRYIPQPEMLFQIEAFDAANTNRWIRNVLQTIAEQYAKDDHHDSFMQESLFRIYTIFNRLDDLMQTGDLQADMNIYTKLIQQIISSSSIPFHGEPIVGTQIMGVLETRNLDFDHLLVLSCNEGNMPKGVNDTSFIPHAVRKAFNLTTIDNKVAIYAYYFHRLLQRASDITLTYNQATSNTTTGEMSRFMLQLLVESRHTIARKNLNAQQLPLRQQRHSVPKNNFVIQKLMQARGLSPTALSNYLRCPLRFYYRFVLKLQEPDAVDDEIDNRIFGNIFHRAAELIYQPWNGGGMVQEDDLAQLLKDEAHLSRILDQAFQENLFDKNGQKKPEYNGLQLINRQVIFDYLKRLLQTDKQLAPFKIVGLEHTVNHPLDIETANGHHSVSLFGNIDRIDEIKRNGQSLLRVVDYKTGRNTKKPLQTIDEVFDADKLQQHADYYLQVMLYAANLRIDTKLNPQQLPVSPALLFIQHATAQDYDPTLLLGKEKVDNIQPYEADFLNLLKELIEEIFNPDIDFNPTEDKAQCASCPYRSICL